MKIKRYMADSMRAALAQVRAEQGPDAVILSTRRVEEGIEVIAAVDYDEALFVDATLKRQPAAAPDIAPPKAAKPAAPLASTAPAVKPSIPAALRAAPEAGASRAFSLPAKPAAGANREVSLPANPAAAANRVVSLPANPAAGASFAAGAHREFSFPANPTAGTNPAAGVAPAAGVPPAVRALPAFRSPPPAAPVADTGYLEMQRELKSLRELMHDELAHMTWHDKRLRNPLQARVLEQLTAMDIAPDIARALATLTPQRTSLKDESHIPLALLLKHLPVVDGLNPVGGGVIALVGPTGAGKTTTIAKLAARWSMQHGCQDLALVSTDGYRIGAREQLMTYARLLGAPMHTANSGAELAQVLVRLKAKKLILIDTAGIGPRDARLAEQLAALKLGAAGARVFLTLPAQGEAHALDEYVRSFAQVTPDACIVTKIDEAASLGAVLSTVLRHRLKVAYLCNGQRVPEDLHAAHERRVWLIRSALKLKEHAPPRVADNFFAHNFGRAHAHV